MILEIRFHRDGPRKEHGYAIVDRQRTLATQLIYYDAAWPSLYCVPTAQDAIARHVASGQWENGDMFLVFKMGKRPPAIAVIAMFERANGSLTPRVLAGDYPDDVKEILAHLKEEG